MHRVHRHQHEESRQSLSPGAIAPDAPPVPATGQEQPAPGLAEPAATCARKHHAMRTALRIAHDHEFAGRAPTPSGVNATVMLHVPSEATEVPQLLETTKSPSAVIEVIANGNPPSFLSVIVCELLAPPNIELP